MITAGSLGTETKEIDLKPVDEHSYAWGACKHLFKTQNPNSANQGHLLHKYRYNTVIMDGYLVTINNRLHPSRLL